MKAIIGKKVGMSQIFDENGHVIPVTVIEAGLGDYTSPPAGIAAMYRNLRGEKALTLVQSREHLYVSPEAEAFLVKE